MADIAKMYLRKLKERGFVTFSLGDRTYERLIQRCQEEGIKLRVDHYEGFLTVVKTSSKKKKVYSSKK